jgi:hypothetical protein
MGRSLVKNAANAISPLRRRSGTLASAAIHKGFAYTEIGFVVWTIKPIPNRFVV